MLERTVGLEIDKTYVDLKAVLVEMGCRVIFEEPPKQILVKQGSLWGITPRTAKKTINYNLTSVGSGTQVTCSSKLSSDWKNLTVIGCASAVILVGLCLWMALDLDAFLASGKANYWSWIATIEGNVSFQIGQTFANLTKVLAVFLSVIIILEAVIAVYVHARLNKFAEQTLSLLLKS